MDMSYKLNNGLKIPPIAIGTWDTISEQHIEEAISRGFCFFDTAYMYCCEETLGNTFEKLYKQKKIKRENLFLQSKAPHNKSGYEQVMSGFQESLKKLKTDYLDSYLIHYPRRDLDNWQDHLIDSWRAMEKLYKDGLVKSIGVSNFLPHHLEWLIQRAEIKPLINQIEVHPLRNQDETIEYCKKHHILVQAYSPMSAGRVFYNQQLMDLAQKYKTSIFKFVLQWHIQNHIIPIIGAHTGADFAELSEKIDFTISKEDLEKIKLLKPAHSGSHMDGILVDWLPIFPEAKRTIDMTDFTAHKRKFKLFNFIPFFTINYISRNCTKYSFLGIPFLKSKQKTNCPTKTGFKIKNKYKIERIFNNRNEFLECPVYDKKNNEIYCVASQKSKIYKINPDTKDFETIPVSEGVIGSIALLENGNIISAENSGLYEINLKKNTRTLLCQLKKDNAHLRFCQDLQYYNDGKLDARGRFIVGTASNYNNNKLYSFDGKTVKVLENNITCSNGIAWSKDNSKMYYVDSPTQKVALYDYNIETGDAVFKQYIIDFMKWGGVRQTAFV